MQTVLTVATMLAPLLAALIQGCKPLLPRAANPDRQDAYVRVSTGIAGVVLALAVYYFTATSFSRAALGDALAEGGLAALMATGLWHGVTGLGAVATTVRAAALTVPPSTSVSPTFPPISNDPLKPSA